MFAYTPKTSFSSRLNCLKVNDAYFRYVRVMCALCSDIALVKWLAMNKSSHIMQNAHFHYITTHEELLHQQLSSRTNFLFLQKAAIT